MNDLVVEARGLRKSYRAGSRRVVAVDRIDLAVERGTVHGFLGPNGSGKTTTIRMLLGLASPDDGEVRLFGRPLTDDLAGILGRVGAFVERPRFSPDLNGRRNLRLLARLGGIPESRVDEVLERVGLTDRGRTKVGGYSFGMRQRLGVAAALLKEPELLILDEPSHGLDPAGILDMRELIRDLGHDGTTVLLSSHILAEVQQVCSAVTIVGEGSVLATGQVQDLLGDRVARTRVRVADPDAAGTALTGAGYVVTRDHADLLVEGHDHPEEITRLLATNGHYVSELSAVRPDLESFFLSLTGHRPGPTEPEERAADQVAERVEVPAEDPGEPS